MDFAYRDLMRNRLHVPKGNPVFAQSRESVTGNCKILPSWECSPLGKKQKWMIKRLKKSTKERDNLLSVNLDEKEESLVGQ